MQRPCAAIAIDSRLPCPLMPAINHAIVLAQSDLRRQSPTASSPASSLAGLQQRGNAVSGPLELYYAGGGCPLGVFKEAIEGGRRRHKERFACTQTPAHYSISAHRALHLVSSHSLRSAKSGNDGTGCHRRCRAPRTFFSIWPIPKWSLNSRTQPRTGCGLLSR